MKTWAEDTATQGCDQSTDSAAGKNETAWVHSEPKPSVRHSPFWRQSDKSREREGSALASKKPTFLAQLVTAAVFVRQLRGPHFNT